MASKCFYCECPITKARLFPGELGQEPGVRSTKDHIIPISRGGIGGGRNIVHACGSCNGTKGNLLPEEFVAALQAGAWRRIRTERRTRMIANLTDLLKAIAPYRDELFKNGKPIGKPSITRARIADMIAEAPRPAALPKASPSFTLENFKRKYPYIYGLLAEANPDLPRWIIDNLMKKTS
jgi:hypothetical protein